MVELKNPAMIVHGVGTASIAGATVPPPTPEDQSRDAESDYALISADLDGGFDGRSIAKWVKPLESWIRRAVHAEAFAKALEKELEELRRKAGSNV